MNTKFWHEKWASNDIAFHRSEANPLLVEYSGALSLAEGGRIFLPLCGKTLDIPWLLDKGYRVAGAELSKIAVGQLFEDLGVAPEITRTGDMELYRAENLDIFAGDIFALSRDILGPVDAVYDRAALVALPEDMRPRYAAHLAEITDHAPQLLICYEYDQSLQEGPPFSIGSAEIHGHYGTAYDISLLAGKDVPGGLKGRCAATENVWLLKNR